MKEFMCPNCKLRAAGAKAPTNHRCWGKGKVREMHQVVTVNVRVRVAVVRRSASRRG